VHSTEFSIKKIAKPLIAVSRCLLGDKVRYDGAVKTEPRLMGFIQQHFSVIGICPEVEIGLSIPRPPLQLTGTSNNIRIQGRDDPRLDITLPMQKYCQLRPSQLDSIQGYIFKSKSPSCGLSNIPLFDAQGKIQAHASGVFAHAIMQRFPDLPVSDELSLINETQWDIFLQRVYQYQS